MIFIWRYQISAVIRSNARSQTHNHYAFITILYALRCTCERPHKTVELRFLAAHLAITVTINISMNVKRSNVIGKAGCLRNADACDEPGSSSYVDTWLKAVPRRMALRRESFCFT